MSVDLWFIGGLAMGLLWSVPAFYFGRASGVRHGTAHVLYDLHKAREERFARRLAGAPCRHFSTTMRDEEGVCQCWGCGEVLRPSQSRGEDGGEK